MFIPPCSSYGYTSMTHKLGYSVVELMLVSPACADVA